MAWLHAVPKPPEGSKRAKSGQAAKATRLDRLKKDGISPAMPPNPMPHVIGRLVEMGLSEAVGMGVGPIAWSTIDVWQRLTGVTLAPWEARLIRQLSVEYVAEGRRAEDETCPPPWRGEVTKTEIDTEQARLRAILG